MKPENLKEERGVSLPELMVAIAISSVVAFGGFKAYEYFIKETKKEAGKMDDLAEFNLLTKDFLKFSEGAGITTAYLNLPIKVKDCDDSEPCIRKFSGQNLIPADLSDIPTSISAQECVQFFKEGKGKLEKKKAYPDKKFTDEVYYIRDTETAPPPTEIYTTWILKDSASPPIFLMKMREGGLVFNYLRGAHVEKSKSGNTKNVDYTFFESSATEEQVKSLIGYPFLIYNTLYLSHFTIQYAVNVYSCSTEKLECDKLIDKINDSPRDDDMIKSETGTQYPKNVYAIKFAKIDMTKDFFQNTKDTQNLPGECLSTTWGNGLQTSDEYWFPSKTYSVWQEPDSLADLGGPEDLNILHLSHYYTVRNFPLSGKGLMAAVPIDIVRYKVEELGFGNKKSLVAELWHATDILKKSKITDLKGPFIITRKIGSSELGLWYNPLKKTNGANQ